MCWATPSSARLTMRNVQIFIAAPRHLKDIKLGCDPKEVGGKLDQKGSLHREVELIKHKKGVFLSFWVVKSYTLVIRELC